MQVSTEFHVLKPLVATLASRGHGADLVAEVLVPHQLFALVVPAARPDLLAKAGVGTCLI